VEDKDALKQLVEELGFWARRYADGRTSYAPDAVNRALDQARALGCTISPDATLQDPDYATSGLFSEELTKAWLEPSEY
jgi:hypothetical protein